MPKNLKNLFVKKVQLLWMEYHLTINSVSKDKFSINIIPHTNKITTLGKLKKGDKVNIEVDILARYINKNIKKIKRLF